MGSLEKSKIPCLPPIKGASHIAIPTGATLSRVPSRRDNTVKKDSETSVSSNETSSSYSSSESEQKQNNEMQMEKELTYSKLKALQAIFEEADEDGGGGLDMEEFRFAMRHTMGNNVSDDELDRIFMKVDTNCDGTVDWDEYLTYMLLECREKDTMNIQARCPFQREVSSIASPHRDSLVRIHHLPGIVKTADGGALDPSRGRMLSVSREGIAAFWSLNYKLKTSHKIDSISPEGKSIWVTDFAVLPYANMLVISTTGRDLLFYDICGKKFDLVSKIAGLECCPTAMHAWCPEKSQRDVVELKLCLLWGDARGGISALSFTAPPSKTAIHPKETPPGNNVTRRIAFKEILADRIPDIKAHMLPDIHADQVRQVAYLAHTKCFLSCCRDTETAMYLGDFKGKYYQHYFKVTKGIYSFEYVPSLNIIVTGGYDALVRVWNPYVPSKAVVLLQGHKSPVTHVCAVTKLEYIISVAENKEVRVHDLNTQTVIQTFYRKMMPGMGPRPFSAVHFSQHSQSLVLATTKMACLEHREEDLSVKQMVSHISPVSLALYNPLFQQVVSVASDSVVCVWHVISGAKVMQFSAYKEHQEGITKDLEITAMAFDPTYRRLITAAREGPVKIWNFNNGACLREYPMYDRCEITAIVCPKQRIVTVGWNKRITIYVDSSDDDTVQCLQPSHKDDITSVVLYGNNMLASSSFDGDIMIWSLETGRMLHCLNADRGNFPFTPANGVKTGYYLPTEVKNHQSKKRAESADEKIVDSSLFVCRKRRNGVNVDENRNANTDYHISTPDELSNVEMDENEAYVSARKSRAKYRKSNIFNQGILPRSKVDDEQDVIGDVQFSTKDDNKPSKQKSTSSVEKLLFLNSRNNLSNVATLLASHSNGLIRAWSVHHNGGLISEFIGSHRNSKSAVHCMDTDPNNIYLITGDTIGYIKVWDISNYHNGQKDRQRLAEAKARKTKFPLACWAMRVIEMKKDSWVRDINSDPAYPTLLTSFRAHLLSVTALNYVLVNDKEFLVSGSNDCSIRLWTIQGEFIGIFGKSNIWRPMGRMCESPEDVGNRASSSMQSSFAMADMRKGFNQIHLPSDIRRVASAASLTCLNAGRRPGWMLARHVVTWLSKYSSTGPTKRHPLEGPLDENQDEESTQIVSDTHLERNLTESSILGKAYKRQRRHFIAPNLPKLRSNHKTIAPYNCLPYTDLEPIEKYEPPASIKEMLSAVKQRNAMQPTSSQTMCDSKGVSLEKSLGNLGANAMRKKLLTPQDALRKAFRRISWMTGGKKKTVTPKSSTSGSMLKAASNSRRNSFVDSSKIAPKSATCGPISGRNGFVDSSAILENSDCKIANAPLISITE